MSSGTNNVFTSWPADDLLAFVLSLFSPLVVGIPLVLTFLIWSIVVLIVLGLPILGLGVVLGEGPVIEFLTALVLLVWTAGFCLGCAVGYTRLLGNFPTTRPIGLSTLAWWVGAPIAAIGYALYRVTTPGAIGGGGGFVLTFGLLVFGAYLVTSRARIVVNAIRSSSGTTATTVITGFVLAGGILEVTTYLLGAPITDIFAENGTTETGMVLAYFPVVLVALLAASVRGTPIGSGSSGLESAIPFHDILFFDIQSGDGITTAVTIAFFAVPTAVFTVEVALGGIFRGLLAAQHPISWGRLPWWRKAVSGVLPRSISGIAATFGRVAVVVSELFWAVAMVALEVLYAAGYTLFISLGTTILAAVVVLAVTVLGLTASLLSPIWIVGTVFGWLIAVVPIVAFGTLPIVVAVLSRELLSPPDGNLFVDPSTWQYPMLIPTVAIGLLVAARSYVLPPWAGVFEQFLAGTLAAILLYRGALYAVMVAETATPLLGSTQRRVRNLGPSGRTAGPTAFAAGVGWLTAAVVIATLRILPGSLAADLLDTLRVVPFAPPPAEFVVGVPVAIGLLLTAAYAAQRAAVGALSYRHGIRHAIRRVVQLGVSTARRTRRWIEYGLFLRP
ncbi:MAG: hypothetical protein V5A36_00870 [Natronomonas sp.]